jgi:hypothetical protein
MDEDFRKSHKMEMTKHENMKRLYNKFLQETQDSPCKIHFPSHREGGKLPLVKPAICSVIVLQGKEVTPT